MAVRHRQKKTFEDPSYDPMTRTFRGTVNWEPTSWGGAKRWYYEMIFSADFGAIVGGNVRWILGDGSADEEHLQHFGINLVYSRLRLGVEDSETAVKAVLLKSGVAPSEADAALKGNDSFGSTVSSVDTAKLCRGVKVNRGLVKRAMMVASSDDWGLPARIGAVQKLTELAKPPHSVKEAEDALHDVLRSTVSGKCPENSEDLQDVRQAAEQALWTCWNESGNAEVDALLQRGLSFLGQQRYKDAAHIFTQIIELAPDFPEGWNKRATARCALGEFASSIDDCKKVLLLKPRHFGCLAGMAMNHISLGENTEAVGWLKKALQVHPSLHGAEQALEQAEISIVVDKHLKPRMQRAIAVFERGEVLSDLPGVSTWDVHQVQLESDESEGTWVYFFRLHIRSSVGELGVMQSRARYYVLQATDGKVFSFTRPTLGDAAFQLEPGGEYKFCWALLVSRELQGAATGTLLERMEFPSESAERFLAESLPDLQLEKAPQIVQPEVAQLSEGYFFTGQLDLRNAGGF